MNSTLLVGIFLIVTIGCAQKKSKKEDGIKNQTEAFSYTGTASVTQGIGTTTLSDIFICERGRKTDVGEITSSDGKKWTVPAATHFTSSEFPFAPDLFNSCNGTTYKNADEAVAAFDNAAVVEIDKTGAVYTAYIFGDNYFEMYVNGIPVGKDKVPFTQFNSSVIKFKVEKPFTIAMKLVDWEEHLGVGCEANRGTSFHPGDGGMVAVIKDTEDQIVAITDQNWKAQTFYTAPIKDLSCVNEKGNIRYAQNCDDTDTDDGSNYYGLHWELPAQWMATDFDDSNWPNAATYTNTTIGVDNKPAYTNFTNIFDDATQDAKFIWSTNVVLDNEVLVRHTIK